jgi:heme A synthase
MKRTTRSFALATAVATFVLLLVGGLVNPTGSSLACPDWPLCYGSAFPEMTGGILYEHSHRLVATGVGLMTVVLGVLLWRDRRRALGVLAIALVVIQGVLGGVTVLLKLPTAVSLAHLGLSMAFFVYLLYLAAGAGERARPIEAPRGTFALVAGAAIAVWVQIVLGGVVRHTSSAMACADEIPWCFGQIWPAAGSLNMQLHMAHRLFGVVAGLLAIAAALAVWRRARWALVIPLLVVVQIVLGILPVTTMVQLHVVEAHLGVGALLLALCAQLTFAVKPAPALPAFATAAEGAP